MNPVWLKYVRALELKERLLHEFSPRRLRVIPYSWPMSAAVCPCDVDFCDFLNERAVRGRSIFHFGTGGHHLVGMRNHREQNRNDILAITASPREHARYVRMLIQDAALGAHYKVLFADIYDLTPTLPRFDYVTLFHLCEFSPRPGERGRLDDRRLVELLAARLNPGGRLLFYRDSTARRASAALLDEFVAAGILRHIEDFRSLQIFAAGAA